MSILSLQIKCYEQEHGSNQSTYWVSACTRGLEGVLCSSTAASLIELWTLWWLSCRSSLSSRGGTTSGEQCFSELYRASTRDPYKAGMLSSKQSFTLTYLHSTKLPDRHCQLCNSSLTRVHRPQPDPHLPCVAATDSSRSSTATGSSLSMAPQARRWSGTPTWSCSEGGRRAPLGCPWWTPTCASWHARVSAGGFVVQPVRCTVWTLRQVQAACPGPFRSVQGVECNAWAGHVLRAASWRPIALCRVCSPESTGL